MLSRGNSFVLGVLGVIGILGGTGTTCDSWPGFQVAELIYNDVTTVVAVDHQPVYVGDNVTFTATVTPGRWEQTIQGYEWLVEGQSRSTSGSRSRTDAFTTTMQQAGTFFVEVTVSIYDGDRHYTDAAGVYVEVLDRPTGNVSKPGLALSADRDSVTQGSSVTVTATAGGGTAPYTYFWVAAGATGYAVGNSTFTQVLSTPGVNTIYCTVRDDKGVDSDEKWVEITVTESESASPCTSPQGTFSTSYGTMVLQVSGSSVTGTYTWRDGTISGSLSGYVFTGTWYESEAPEGYKDGPCRFEFSEDWQSFSGSWGYEPGVDKGSWSGWRTDSCGQ